MDDDDDGTVAKQANFASLHLNEERWGAPRLVPEPVQTGREELRMDYTMVIQKFFTCIQILLAFDGKSEHYVITFEQISVSSRRALARIVKLDVS